MGEFIIFLVVAAAGFAVGRLTSRKGAGASSGYPYGSGLPHPARIFEEGYEAGRREAALAQQSARSAGAGTNSPDTPGAFLPPPAPPAQPYPRQHRPQPLPPQPLPGGLLPPGPLPETRRPFQPPAETPQRAAQGQAPAHPAPPQHPTPDAPAQLPGHPLLPAAAGPGAPRPENPVPAVPGAGDHPRAVPPAAAPRTAAELAAEKRRRDLRNINITLYSGSLLLVAAAALFIGISIPEQARFAGVALMTALFYASGLVIHSRKKSLRPAAVAFTGTGLALIPVVGLAFYNLILPDPVLAWLATSLAGTAAFAYAAARLESRVVTYLALTFLLSTALASGASLRSGILWYFISTVLLATLISLAAVRRPGWLRNIYLEAFVASHRFLVPATAAAAVLTAAELGPGSLAVLFLAIAAYYGVLVWQGPRNQTLLHTYGLRAAGAAGMVFLVFHAADSWPAALLAAVIITGIQVPALNAGSGRYLRMAARADLPGAAQAGDPRTGGATRGPGQRGARIYVADLLTVTGLQFVAGLAAAVAYALNAQNGTGTPLLFAATATVVQLTLCTVAWRLSQHAEYVAPAGVLLPAVACLLTGTAELWPVLVNLGILTAFFVLRAARSLGSGRAAFVLAARASAAVGLPLTVFALLQNAAPENAMAWTLAAAFLAAAANQAWTVLAEATGRRELFPRAVPAVFASAALLCAAALRFEEFPTSALALTALWTVVLLNAVYSALPVDRGRGKTAVAYAPAGFLFAGVLGAGLLGVRGYELLCTAALAYCALQSFKPAVPRLRGWYFAAGQVLLTVLAGLVTHDLGLGPHKVFAVVAAALAVQLAARTVLGARLEGFGPVHGLRWGTLLALAATAPAYYLVLSPETEQQTGSMLLLIAAAGAVLTQVAAALRRAPAQALRSEPAAAAALVFLLCAGMRVVEGQTTTLTLAVLWVAFAANLTTAALHRYGVLAFLAPGGFLAAMLLGTGILGLRGYELILAAALAYCAAMVRDRASRARGIYLAGAQGAGAVLAALLAADVSGHSTAVFFAALGIALAAGQILRTVLHRRVHPLGSAEPLRWGGLVALVLVPVVYMQFGRTEPAALLITVLSAAAAFTAAQLDAAQRTFRKAALPNTAELVLAAAAAVLLAVPAVRLIEGPYAVWALGLLWLGLGANIAASLLLGPGRWEALAAGGFAGAALTGAGLLGLRGYELLVLAALACALFLARLRQPRRGQYLLAAQLLTAVLAVLLAADAGADIHGVVAAGAAAGAAAQLARTVLEPRQAGPWARAALWTSMGLLVFAPVLYAALAPGEIQRDVTALLLLLLLAVSAAGYARTTRAAALYPGLYALGALPLVLSDVLRFGIGGLLPDPAVPVVAAGLVLAALAAAALTGEARARDASLRTALLGACVAYCAAVPAAAAASGGNLLLAALAPAVLSAGALTVSHSRGIPWLAAGTPPLLFGAAALAAAGFEQEILPRPFPPGYELLWTVWATALVLQAVRLLLSLGENASPLRLRILGAASSLILLTGAVPAMAEYNSSAVAGSLTLLAALALAVRETPQTSRETAIEAGCLPAALAVERIVWFVLGGAGWFWSVQYWAVVLAALAGWEYLRRRQVRGTVLLGAAAVILSGSGLITAVSGGTGEQLWALVAHAGLLVFGLLASRKLFTIWGASGVALAVLWYLRGYTFLLLALLAAGLIALAVWRLSRVRTAAEQESEEVLEER